MPRHLYPGYRPSKSVALTAGSSTDASQIEDDEDEGKFVRIISSLFEVIDR